VGQARGDDTGEEHYVVGIVVINNQIPCTKPWYIVSRESLELIMKGRGIG
jgi:hypothetical protein